MILEPKTVLILRCDRCNTPHLDSEYEVPCLWDSREQIEEAFKSDPGDGWQKVGDQFLCEPCVPVGAVPLSAIDEAVVRRERASYAGKPPMPDRAFDPFPRIPVDETRDGAFDRVFRLGVSAADSWAIGPNGPYQKPGQTGSDIARAQVRESLLHLLEIGFIDIDTVRLFAAKGYPLQREPGPSAIVLADAPASIASQGVDAPMEVTP